MFSAVALLAPPDARAGHEVPFYPSFYPQEIRIEPLAPEAAARELAADRLHAYVGAAPRFGAASSAHLKSADSLRSLITARVNPRSKHGNDRDARCRALELAVGMLADRSDIVTHPYPITPYHADYFDHADLVPDTGRGKSSAGGAPALAVRASDPGIEALLRPDLSIRPDDWDVEFAEVSTADLARATHAVLGAWPSPQEMKEGWFQAYHLLRPAVGDPAARERADASYRRLTRDAFKDEVEKLDLERGLVATLTRGCDIGVVGYRTRREFYNDNSTNGIENIAVDSQSGFNSPAFIRTVKLKDFPWNGWLRLGVATPPRAAWNPVAGFGDAAGRLVWATVGDDAYLPIPFNSRWVENRVQPHTGGDPRLKQITRAPGEIVLPEPGTGLFRPVSPAKSATAKLSYRVLASPFHDGSTMEPADLLYPFALAFRWGGGNSDGPTHDPDIAAATRPMRERLRGIHVVRIEETVFNIADVAITYRHPIVDVYLDGPPSADQKSMLLAPPWSTVPWHVLALMEAAVERGIGAFSRGAAERRRVPWLDLVRDPEQRAKMTALIGEFARTGYRPKALETLVSPEAATARWRALEKFAGASGHLLVTNGGYRLASWSPEASVFAVVRDASYPVGLGTFDNLPYPPRALITGLEHVANRIVIAADVEYSAQEQRSRRLVRMPLKRDTLRGTFPIRRAVRYVVVDDTGKVAAAGTGKPQADGRFAVSLPPSLPPGPYTLSTAVFLDGNTINPQISRYSFRSN
ncbi:MAG: hypothetical protein IT564_08585 [Rhodospirillales bacterium]|nr:hypothetical protein [Rhodospirillales bacterium]